jgi:hypothetical protein
MQCASMYYKLTIFWCIFISYGQKLSNLLKIATISKSVRSCSLLFGHVNANRNFSIPWPSKGQKRAFIAINIKVLVKI